MLPGTTFEQVINLSRSNTGKAVKANLNINGDEKLLKWITVENKEGAGHGKRAGYFTHESASHGPQAC